jgi:hypothetical protein
VQFTPAMGLPVDNGVRYRLRGRKVPGHDGLARRADLGRQPGPPYQAARLARAGAVAFARHGDRQRRLAASMFLAFLVGGGRQHCGATLTLWRVWPRWSAAVTTLATGAGMLALLRAGLTVELAVPAWIAAGALAIAALLRAASGWSGLPAGSMLVGNVAATGAPGTGRRLLAAVCAEADQRGWTLALLARRDRPKLVVLYRELLFEPIAIRGVRLIMVRRRQG